MKLVIVTFLLIGVTPAFASLQDEWNSKNAVSCESNLNQQISNLTKKFYGDKVVGLPQETTVVFNCNVGQLEGCNNGTYKIFAAYTRLTTGQVCKFNYAVEDRFPCEIAGTTYEDLGCR